MHIAPSVIAIPGKQVEAVTNPSADPLRQIPIGSLIQEPKECFPMDCRQKYQNLNDFTDMFQRFQHV